MLQEQVIREGDKSEEHVGTSPGAVAEDTDVILPGTVAEVIEPQTGAEKRLEQTAQNEESTRAVSREEPQVLGKRISQPSVRLKDYVTYNARCDPAENKHASLVPPAASMTSLTVPGNVPYPIKGYVTDALFSEKHQVFFAAIS